MNRSKGILLVMGASSVFGLMPLFARIGMSNGLNAITIIMYRSFFASMILFVYLKKKKIAIFPDRAVIKELFLVSFIGYGLMLLTLFYSYRYIPTGMATSIHYIYPSAVLIGSVLIYKEKLTLEKTMVVLVAFIGILMMSVDQWGNAFSWAGIFLAFVSGVFYAYYILKASHSPIREINSYLLVYYISISNFFYFLLIALMAGSLSLEVTWVGYADMIVLAVFSVAAMAAFKTGLCYISSWAAAVLSSFEPVTSIAVGLVIFKEGFNAGSITGAVLIILSVVYLSTIAEQSLNNRRTIVKKSRLVLSDGKERTK